LAEPAPEPNNLEQLESEQHSSFFIKREHTDIDAGRGYVVLTKTNNNKRTKQGKNNW
jgi:hypothetical protein